MEQIAEAILELKAHLGAHMMCQAIQLLCITIVLGIIAFGVHKNRY